MKRKGRRDLRVFVGGRRGPSQEITGIKGWVASAVSRTTPRMFYSPAPAEWDMAVRWTVVASFDVDDPMLKRLRQAAKEKTVLRLTGGNDFISEVVEGRIRSFRKLKGDQYRFTLDPIRRSTPLDRDKAKRGKG